MRQPSFPILQWSFRHRPERLQSAAIRALPLASADAGQAARPVRRRSARPAPRHGTPGTNADSHLIQQMPETVRSNASPAVAKGSAPPDAGRLSVAGEMRVAAQHHRQPPNDG